MHTLSPPQIHALPARLLRAVLLDLDGTLVDTAGDFCVAINAMRAEYGLGALAQHDILRHVGKGSEHLVQGVLAADWPAAQVEQTWPQALQRYQFHYQACNGVHSALYPEVMEGLQALRELGLRLACVTNKPLAFAKPLLLHFGLAPYMELVYGGDSWPQKKPHPQALLQACEAFGLHPSCVLMVGDSENDARAARAAGCPVWLLPYGYNHGQDVQETDSDGIVNTLLQAAQAIAVHQQRFHI
ncbi:phosphoglycolate phosphatase [Massilia sp. W12]|uniref:phosphoglycolate phosphatase n=1 Tax=Massilia sp. W12 TaxID=3126507 RepID=UPI0030CA6AAF